MNQAASLSFFSSAAAPVFSPAGADFLASPLVHQSVRCVIARSCALPVFQDLCMSDDMKSIFDSFYRTYPFTGDDIAIIP
jgi:hypothetical protein